MDVFEKFSHIGTLIFDVDGVFTDCGLLVTEQGHFLRVMSARDGLGVRLATEAGLNLVIITGGDSDGVFKRLQKLGIRDIFQKAEPKLDVYRSYITSRQIDPGTVLYMGDDLLDLEVMQEVFLPVCPADAAPEVKAISEYISPITGGKGCVRDVIEKVLMARNLWKY